MQMSRGLKEDGIEAGNYYDKYHTRNPIARWMVNNFEQSLMGLVDKVDPQSIHEVGCGEGYWSIKWTSQGKTVKGTDFSSQVIDMAKENSSGLESSARIDFEQKNIYDLDPAVDSAELTVCCEVMEHIDQPQKGLKKLKAITQKHAILSVPNEPLWRILNMARGKYIGDFGNTPGHIQHWSKAGFVRLVGDYFDVVEVLSPLPWTMLLCTARDK